MSDRYCFVCRAPIRECMGSVVAGDFVLAVLGKLPWKEVRERCALCYEIARREAERLEHKNDAKSE